MSNVMFWTLLVCEDPRRTNRVVAQLVQLMCEVDKRT